MLQMLKTFWNDCRTLRNYARTDIRFAGYYAHVLFEQRTGWSVFFLSPLALATYLVEKLFLSRAKNQLIEFGNYYLDRRGLNKDSVVYSVGVGRNVSFDEALVDKYDCTIHLFDPTPRSIEFMSQKANPKLQHLPIAIWVENGRAKMFHDKSSSPAKVRNGSLTNLYATADSFDVDCRRLDSVMQELGHDHIDVLKMDIEGAALPVLEKILEQGTLPRQIAAEFERPLGLRETSGYLLSLVKVIRMLKAHGYATYTIRKRLPGFTVEMVAVRAREAVAHRKAA